MAGTVVTEDDSKRTTLARELATSALKSNSERQARRRRNFSLLRTLSLGRPSSMRQSGVSVQVGGLLWLTAAWVRLLRAPRLRFVSCLGLVYMCQNGSAALGPAA